MKLLILLLMSSLSYASEFNHPGCEKGTQQKVQQGLQMSLVDIDGIHPPRQHKTKTRKEITDPYVFIYVIECAKPNGKLDGWAYIYDNRLDTDKPETYQTALIEKVMFKNGAVSQQVWVQDPAQIPTNN